MRGVERLLAACLLFLCLAGTRARAHQVYLSNRPFRGAVQFDGRTTLVQLGPFASYLGLQVRRVGRCILLGYPRDKLSAPAGAIPGIYFRGHRLTTGRLDATPPMVGLEELARLLHAPVIKNAQLNTIDVYHPIKSAPSAPGYRAVAFGGGEQVSDLHLALGTLSSIRLTVVNVSRRRSRAFRTYGDYLEIGKLPYVVLIGPSGRVVDRWRGTCPSAAQVEQAATGGGTQLDGQTQPVTSGDYSFIDNYALAASPADERSVASLAAYLNRPCHDNLERARAIYRWETDRIAYDYRELQTGVRAEDCTPAAVLRRRLAVCDGYAHLFQALAQAMGLQCRVLDGSARCWPTYWSTADHAWDAVRVKRGWGLVDATWGAGDCDAQGFHKRFSGFWFLTPPAEFAYTHRPSDPQWQLLAHPISRTEFESRPVLLPAFFEQGLRLGSGAQGRILAQAGSQVEVTLGVPKALALMSSLSPGHQAPVRIRCQGNTCSFVVQVPESPGEYTLHIDAGPRRSSGREELEEVAQYAIKVP